MPAWFADFAVERQQGVADSTLELYRAALHLRHELQVGETLTWHEAASGVVWFSRDNGWHSITNVGTKAAALPPGRIVLASGATPPGVLPGETTVWLR